MVLLAAGLGGWIWLGDDDTGDADSSDAELTGCPTPDSSWPHVDVPEGASAEVQSDGFTYIYTVRDFYYQRRAPDPTEIIVRVELANETTGVPDTADGSIYYAAAGFETLFVDRVSQNKPVCFSIVSGGVNIDPGTRAIALLGFVSTEDPTDAPLSLRTKVGVEIPITTGS